MQLIKSKMFCIDWWLIHQEFPLESWTYLKRVKWSALLNKPCGRWIHVKNQSVYKKRELDFCAFLIGIGFFPLFFYILPTLAFDSLMGNGVDLPLFDSKGISWGKILTSFPAGSAKKWSTTLMCHERKKYLRPMGRLSVKIISIHSCSHASSKTCRIGKDKMQQIQVGKNSFCGEAKAIENCPHRSMHIPEESTALKISFFFELNATGWYHWAN